MTTRPPTPNPGDTAAGIQRFLELLVQPGAVFEVRAPKCLKGPRGDFRSTASGFYTSDQIPAAAAAIADLDAQALAAGIYITLNPVKPELLALANHRIDRDAKVTTTDADIICRTRLLIDLDPVRKSGISSTDEELKAAQERAAQVVTHLDSLGWPEPLVTMSGNGAGLIYAIDLPTEDNGLVERNLKALAAKFNDDRVTIDTSVHNPSRITKIIGTMARKGDELLGVSGAADRPHRRSLLVSAPDKLVPVPRPLLESLAGPLPEQAPFVAGRIGPSMDSRDRFAKFDHTADGVATYLASFGMEITNRVPKENGTWLHLSRCPIVAECNATSGSDIAVIVGGDGRIGYKNLHNRGVGLGWLDLREALEPGYKTFVQSHRAGAGPATHDEDGSKLTAASAEGPKDASRAKMLVGLAQELFRIGLTLKGEPFAVRKAGPNVALTISSGTGPLRDMLSSEAYRRYGFVASATTLTDALTTLRGQAMACTPEAVHLRVAPHNDGVVLDLGSADGAAVVVTKRGWKVEQVSPVLFQRTALTSAMRPPARGGSLDQLRTVLNVTEESWPVLAAWMVAALIPEVPHPILMFGGQQGSGKTTAARYIVGVFDPSTAPTRTQPKDLVDWAVSVSGSWTSVFDNVSSIPAWWSDALCKIVTGDGMVRRSLYTDNGLAVLAYKRVVAITSIDAGALRGDLAERLLLVDLEPISSARRRSEKALDRRYEEIQPLVLGALLDLLVLVLARMDAIPETDLPRMADFAKVLAAMDEAIGTDSLRRFKEQSGRIAADVVAADPVATAIMGLMKDLHEWHGTASELLARIQPEKPGRDWPNNGMRMAAKLKRLAPALLLQGVQVVPYAPNDKTRTYGLVSVPPTDDGTNPDSPRAVGPGGFDNRPSNRPSENGRCDAPKADSGRLGGSGGFSHTSSLDPPDE